MKSIASNDPKAHAANVRENLREIREHLRGDIAKVDDPRAKALFETTAEVLGGLETAFQHYEGSSEEAWH